MTQPIVGSIVYNTNQGLGILAKSFYDQGLIQYVLVQPHPKYRSNPAWYLPDVSHTWKELGKFLSRINVLLIFENAFRWQAVEEARRRGIKIVLMPMYEYTPFPAPAPVDLYLAPSALDYQYYTSLYQNSTYYNAIRFIEVPVEVPWKRRDRAEVFVHNAGHGGKDFRNGTPEILEAMKYVKSPIKLIVRGQPDSQKIARLFKQHAHHNDSRIDLRLGEVPKAELYSEGDVFLFPEKFNGLSLPIQEAYASGMLVMASDRVPNRLYLPTAPLIPVARYEKKRIALQFDSAVIDPKAIAGTIDAWYGRDIMEYSFLGKDVAQELYSWERLRPIYSSIFQEILG